MNLRETLNENSGRTVAVVVVLIVIGCAAFVFQSRGPSAPDAPTREFFTIDDGKTWFADDASKLPPFEKDGKQAVRAHVFRSANGEEFVNHLERFKPDAKKALEQASVFDPNRKGPPKNLAVIQSAYTTGREVKRPGDAKWIGTGSIRDAEVIAVKSPDGSVDAIPVEP